MAQGEDAIGEAASVAVMLFDAEIGLMLKPPIKDMGGFDKCPAPTSLRPSRGLLSW